MESVYKNEITYLTFKTNINKLLGSFFKRFIDILAVVAGMIILWPFFVYVAVRIKNEDPGPLFYRGPRVGMGGKKFDILKFRTMYERPESYQGPRITAANDDRVTPIGRWLRDTKLNELPQLWNVLVGEMSLVGPRPEDPEIFAALPKEYRDEILTVRPGITSPASVTYHDEESILSSDNFMVDYATLVLPDKLRMDRLYVRHHNLISDFDTIFWTLIILIPRIGKNKISEGWLYNGPFARFVRHYFTWFIIDFLTALAGIAIVGIGWRLVEPLDLGISNSVLLAVILAFSFGMSNSVLGVNQVSWQRAAASDVFKLIFSSLFVGVFYTMLNNHVPLIASLPRLFIVYICLAVLGGYIAARYRMRLITGLASRWVNMRNSIGVGERVLIVGAGNAGEFAAWVLKRPDFRHFYQAIGYVDDAPGKQGMRFDGIKVLGTTADIPDLVQKHNIGMLLYSIRDASEADKARILSCCKRTHLPVVHVPELIDSMQQTFAESVLSAG